MGSGVAIIIPTCDRPETLVRAVNSALNQTVKAEVVVVDDGVIPPRVDSSVLVIKTPRPYSGPAKARNLGILNCSPMADKICYLDDDDELLPEYVKVQSGLIDKGHEFGFSLALYKYADGSETIDPEPGNKGVKNYYDATALLKQNIAPISSFIHSTSAWSKIGGWDETLLRMEDWDFWGRMFIACGQPSMAQTVTNVINKGGSVSRSDYNVFAYAMSCHWRDIIDDRLKFLSGEKRGVIYYGDPLPRVPSLTVVVSELQDWSSILASVAKCPYEVVVIHGDWRLAQQKFSPSKWIRLFEPSPTCNTVAKQLSFGMILSRSKYVWFGNAYDQDQFSELDHNSDLYVVSSPRGVVCKRSVLERIGGLADLPMEEAISEFVGRAREKFKVKEIQ